MFTFMFLKGMEYVTVFCWPQCQLLQLLRSLATMSPLKPYTSNIYTRRVLSGEFQVVNHHLLKDLTELNLWNEEMKQKLIAHNGSIQVHWTIPSI